VSLTASERDISFLSGDTALEGSARIPSGARGIVVFAHGSGSGRHSPRNRQVAAVLTEAGLATPAERPTTAAGVSRGGPPDLAEASSTASMRRRF
jgi:predicted alpha/beta-hydrolase family hydrolase